MENEYVVLYRFDWNSKHAQQKVFNSAMLKNVLNIGKGGGIKIEFASSSLLENLYVDESSHALQPDV